MDQPIQPYSFSRIKGKKVIAEYIIIDRSRLEEANNKYGSSEILMPITYDMLQNTNILEDYRQVMRLCKTYIADTEVFALCREIEQKIGNIIRSRFLLWGSDRGIFFDKPLSITREESDK